jgi:hypothetical protein
VKLTLETRSSAFNAKMPIPRLSESGLIGLNNRFYSMKLDGTKPKVDSQCDRFQPKLRREIVSVHVDMAWFVRLMAVEIEPIWAGPQSSWHASILPNCHPFRTGIH